MGNLLSEQVAEAIKKKIQNGEFSPGDQLPNEQAFMSELNVSRSTLREAIKLLRSRNIVQIKWGVGTFVADMPGMSDDPLGMNLIPEKQRILELQEFWLMLEPIIAKLACERRQEEDIRILREYNAQLRRCRLDLNLPADDRIAEIKKIDHDFHSAICASAHNHVMNRIFQMLQESVETSFTDVYYQKMQMDHSLEIHEQIVEALAAQREETVIELMQIHMREKIETIYQE